MPVFRAISILQGEERDFIHQLRCPLFLITFFSVAQLWQRLKATPQYLGTTI